MSITVRRDIPEKTPTPTESPFPGYPLGVWPHMTSAFCADPLRDNPRHHDCSLPGCACSCHARPQAASAEALEQGVKPGPAIGQQLERLGSDRDSTRAPARRA